MAIVRCCPHPSGHNIGCYDGQQGCYDNHRKRLAHESLPSEVQKISLFAPGAVMAITISLAKEFSAESRRLMHFNSQRQVVKTIAPAWDLDYDFTSRIELPIVAMEQSMLEILQDLLLIMAPSILMVAWLFWQAA